MLKQFAKLSPGAILTAIAAVALLITSPAKADDASEEFVQNILDEAEPILNAPTRAELLSGVEDLVDKYVDMRRVSLFVLGQYARQITDEQKDVYIPLFADYSTQIYQDLFDDYAGQELEVVNSVDRSDRDIIVNSRIADPAPGDPLTDTIFHWRVYRNRDGELAIVDAGADNVWLAINQQSEFKSVISNNGGPPAGIDALIENLREKTGG